MILFYSATGNSAFAARTLAELIGDEAVDVFNYIRNSIAGEFTSTRPWVFVSPTHGWRLPRIFDSFLRSAYITGSREAYFVMTCGTDTGSASKYNAALCREKGLIYMGTLSLVMPENYLAMFAVPDEAESRSIVSRAKPVLQSAAELISHGRPFAPEKQTPLDALKSGVVNSAFCRFIISDRRFTASDKCIGCGKCASVCPTLDISLESGRPVWHGKCTHCMACITSCPVEAIEYGRASRGKPRYRCPE